MPLLHKIRLRVLAVLVALTLAVWAAISLAALPALPVLGVAIFTAAAAVNQLTARLGTPTCGGCGGKLEGSKLGAYGIECPHCGRLNAPPTRTADRGADDTTGARRA